MQISMKSALIGIAVICLIVVAVSSTLKNQRVLEEQRKSQLGDIYTLRFAVNSLGISEDLSKRNELQGGTYRILCSDQYSNLKKLISHQVELLFTEKKNDLVEISFVGPVGPVGRENNELLKLFVSDVQVFLKKATANTSSGQKIGRNKVRETETGPNKLD